MNGIKACLTCLVHALSDSTAFDRWSVKHVHKNKSKKTKGGIHSNGPRRGGRSSISEDKEKRPKFDTIRYVHAARWPL